MLKVLNRTVEELNEGYLTDQVIVLKNYSEYIKKDLKEKTGTKSERSKKLGLILSEKLKKAKIEEIVFDKGSFRYHGRVKAVAEGAREGGLKF